ncbi:MAG TPA: dUTP diphosphatase, partial [Atribacterota bacterium]|nr:dUTP diphosphatase [Atribacterota bacterium]
MENNLNIDEVEVKIERTKGCEGLPLPKAASKHASGIDLHSAEGKTIEIKPGERKLISTGIKLALPAGYEAQVRPRSGLANGYGITVLNSPGTIDADYRGIIKVILINHGKESFYINQGDRIAQLVIQKIVRPVFIEIQELDSTK